ncbi:MAG TPA: hypothetical protein VL995_02930 [Cellvibrio sp.]|nr:hypothetical protein [Cellvibrio sp.]
MRDEYDFSKGKRGGFYHPDAKVHFSEKDDVLYGNENNPEAAMTDYSLTPEAEALVRTELQKKYVDWAHCKLLMNLRTETFAITNSTLFMITKNQSTACAM